MPFALKTAARRLARRAAACAAGMLLAGAASAQAGGPVSVLTQHNDNLRTGANIRETILNTRNVNARQFGKLFARHVAGQIYAQPLYVPGVTVPGHGTHNVVFVATEHNDVYAFDADDPKQAAPLWHVNLGPCAQTPNDDFGNSPDYGRYHDLFPEIGVTSTPVIDPASGTIYVSDFVRLSAGHYIQQLHALDLRDGAERPGSPVTIKGAVPGTGDGSQGGRLVFNAAQQLQRTGLLLSRGVVYLGFGAHADVPPNHGWLFGYDAKTLKQVGVFCATPNGTDGGIWEAGQGLNADADGHIYCLTGNGTTTAQQGGKDYSQAFLKMTPGPAGLTVSDWFIPYNADLLSAGDSDIGGGGGLCLPDSPLIIGGGKSGMMYVLDRNKMGHWRQDDDSEAVQSFQACAGHIHGSPVYWNGETTGPMVYVWGEHDYLKAFKIVNRKLETTPASQGADLPGPNMPGGFLSVSADGDKAGTGIVWATAPVDDDANMRAVAGVLRAYDASDVSKVLWTSLQDPARDDYGLFAKFCPPTIANGKVYLPTFSNELVVYGLLNPGATKTAAQSLSHHAPRRHVVSQ